VCLECFLGESGSDFADRLELLAVGVVAGEEECAVDVCAFAFPEVGTDDNEVEAVADACEIVFLELMCLFSTK
jgi:hypothetical protein